MEHPARRRSPTYDYLDFVHGANVFLNALAGASTCARSLISVGAENHSILIFSELMDSESLFLTANAVTVYFSKPPARPAAAAAIERAHRRRRRRVEVHRDPHAVHPDWATRHPKGQRARPRRDRVHPPGQPCWRPDLDTHVAVANEVQSLDGQLVGLARLGEQDDSKASLGLT